MPGIELGINTMYPDFETLIRKLAEFEYSHIYFARVFNESDRELERIAGFCRQYGILPSGAHAPGQFLPHDEADLDQTIELHKKVLDQAVILGCDSVNFHVVRELALHADKNNVMIAIENLSRDIVADYCKTTNDLKRIIRGAGQSNVGICIDTGHAHISSLRSSDMILEAGDKLIQTHINDNFGWLCEENAINDMHSPPGTGTIDWLRVVNALDKIGYERPITFELKFRGNPERPDELDDFLRLTRDNWRMITLLWQYVKENLSESLE